MYTVSIVSPSDGAVNPAIIPRLLRADIPATEIDPTLGAFGRHITEICSQRARSPHSRDENADFGQVLRTLELRACN